MPISYERCDESVEHLLQELIKKFHSPLKEAAVTFDLTFASKFDKETGEMLPAIKLHGVYASAKVRITTLEDRSRGVPDVKIVIDRGVWANAPAQTKAAILDHELTHVALKDEGGHDDLGRPKLRLREHDWMTWGFDRIAERYKDFAPEVQGARDLVERLKQMSFSFVEIK